MNRFKIGFVALVAILAMSFTLMSHKSAIKPIKYSSGTCDKNVDFVSGTYYTGTGTSNCSGSTATIDATHGLNKFVASATTFTDNTVTCNGGSTFCCFEESASTSCSPDLGSLPQVSLIITKQ